jgi:bifunctional non-homologous end joining protein LigD
VRQTRHKQQPADALEAYRAKRDFGRTPEPMGQAPRRSDRPLVGGRFCVQKHHASHLHYDLRLEHDGVLLSWAVPKGPSLRPGEKRLAMMTEPHPLEYLEFEGVIPQGYGAGVVVLWDLGRWQMQTSRAGADQPLEGGELKFLLDGYKLNGKWLLVRSPGRGGPGAERRWLLIKRRDAWAGDVDITALAPRSIRTQRDAAQILVEELAEAAQPRER